MVRDIRIKTLDLADNGDWSGTNTFDTATVNKITSKTINGEILGVEWAFNRTGSIALSLSGTGQQFFRRLNGSGTGWQTTQPRVFSQDPLVGSIANAEHVSFLAHGPVVLDIGSMASGTQVLSMTVKYR